MGRMRQGAQYSYFQRNLWSGTDGPLNPAGGASGTDNVFETSFAHSCGLIGPRTAARTVFSSHQKVAALAENKQLIVPRPLYLHVAKRPNVNH
jgi:hypothetical protein